MKLRDYVIRRLLLLIPVILGVSIIIFGLGRLGNQRPETLYINERMTPAQVQAIMVRYGFDQPIEVQYLRWLEGLLQGDLGYSKAANMQVTAAIAKYFPATFELTTVSIIIAVIIGVPSGIVTARHRNEPVDHVTRLAALFGVSLPIFFLAILLKWVFYFQLHWLPPGGRFDPNLASTMYDAVPHLTQFYTIDSLLAGNLAAFGDAIVHLLMPAIALSYASAAVITRLMRSSMLETLGSEYVKTARAKGVSEKLVIRKHAVRNAMIPTTTIIGLSYGGLLGGAVLTETIFSWNGVGQWSTLAILSADRASILGFTLLAAVIYVVVNLIVDIVYAYLDPRIRLE